jgi:hypothetical protein
VDDADAGGDGAERAGDGGALVRTEHRDGAQQRARRLDLHGPRPRQFGGGDR